MTDAWGTLHFEVLDDEILITLPGTSYAAVFSAGKPVRFPR
jgi:hypothetical protein